MAERTCRLSRHECPSPSACEVSCRVRAGKLPGRSGPASPRDAAAWTARRRGDRVPRFRRGGFGAQRPPAELGVTALPSPDRVTGDSLRDPYGLFQATERECGAPHSMSTSATPRATRSRIGVLRYGLTCTTAPLGAAIGARGRVPVMDFAAVVRSRRMVRSYQPGRAVSDAVLDRILQNAVHAPSAGFSQGWDFVVLRRRRTSSGSGRRPPTPQEEPDAWLQGMRTAPGARGLPLRPRALPDPLRGARQGLDRPGRGALAGAVLGRRHRDGGAAHAAHRGGRGPRRLLLRRPARAARRRCSAALGAPADRRIVGVVSLGHVAPDRRSPSLRRGRRRVDEVAHDGRFGVPWRLRGRI